MQGTDSDLMDGETEGDTVVIAGQPEVLSTQAMQVIEFMLRVLLIVIISVGLTKDTLVHDDGIPLLHLQINLCLQVENELVDLIDELLERDAGTVNSTIIGKPVN